MLRARDNIHRVHVYRCTRTRSCSGIGEAESGIILWPIISRVCVRSIERDVAVLLLYYKLSVPYKLSRNDEYKSLQTLRWYIMSKATGLRVFGGTVPFIENTSPCPPSSAKRRTLFE